MRKNRKMICNKKNNLKTPIAILIVTLSMCLLSGCVQNGRVFKDSFGHEYLMRHMILEGYYTIDRLPNTNILNKFSVPPEGMLMWDEKENEYLIKSSTSDTYLVIPIIREKPRKGLED